MSSKSDDVAAARDLLWRDVLTWVSSWGDVAHSDDSRTVVVDRRYGREEVLAFGAEEWAEFVYFGEWYAGPRDPAVYDADLSGYAVDELFETMGSKGSPLVVRDARLEREQPPDRFPSVVGQFGWVAFRSGGSRGGDDERWQRPPRGSVIRLMGDYGVDVPLWSLQDGLMFSSPDELMDEFGVSRGLARDLASWGMGWEDNSRQPHHNAEAERLVGLLAEELQHLGYRFVFQP